MYAVTRENRATKRNRVKIVRLPQRIQQQPVRSLLPSVEVIEPVDVEAGITRAVPVGRPFALPELTPIDTTSVKRPTKLWD